MTNLTRAFALIFLVSGVLYVGCEDTISSDSGGSAGILGTDACAELGELCHEADNGTSGLGHECHELGHDGVGSACLARYDECKTYCEALLAQGGATGQAGGGGDSHGGAVGTAGASTGGVGGAL